MESYGKKTVLCFGDSGCGKSSFINCFLKKENHLPTSGEGNSCTMETTVIEGYHKDIGMINFIDTRGTNDTDEFDESFSWDFCQIL